MVIEKNLGVTIDFHKKNYVADIKAILNCNFGAHFNMEYLR